MKREKSIELSSTSQKNIETILLSLKHEPLFDLSSKLASLVSEEKFDRKLPMAAYLEKCKSFFKSNPIYGCEVDLEISERDGFTYTAFMNIEHDPKDEFTPEELMDHQRDYLWQEMRDLFRNTCIDGSRPEEIDKNNIHCYFYCELDHKDLRQDLEAVVRRVKLMNGRKAWGF